MMARQAARSMWSHPALISEEAERPERRWGRAVYVVGFGVFALGFVGMAVSVTTGSEVLVIACIAVVVLGGIAAGIGLHQMFGSEMRELWGGPEPGDPGDDGGGWGHGPGPGETPPEAGGTPPDGQEQPEWWPSFEHDLKSWMLEGATGPMAPEGLTEP